MSTSPPYSWIIIVGSLLLLGCAQSKEEAVQQYEAVVDVADAVQDSLPSEPRFTESYVMGQFNPAEHPDFVVVDNAYTDGDQTYYLRRETYEAFQLMHRAAAEAGVALTIVSATRNFNRQKTIWEAKWIGERLLEGSESAPEAYPEPGDRALAILRYSSMPGTSRHHWGTDIDLNNLNNRYFEQGPGKKVYDWLQANAAEYGFCQPYSAKGPERPNGYNEERWHWSYLPLAQPLTEFAASHLSNDEISGFQGAEAAVAIDVVANYVLGINPACQ